MELREDNKEAAQIYQVVRGQVRTLGEQVIDLDYTALKIVMDLYGIRNQRDVFEKVRSVFYHFLNERRKDEG